MGYTFLATNIYHPTFYYLKIQKNFSGGGGCVPHPCERSTPSQIKSWGSLQCSSFL